MHCAYGKSFAGKTAGYMKDNKMNTFEGFGLSQALNASLSKMNYTTPTPIQEQAIPLALKGRDVLGSAQTGTGKTAAFSIPLVENLLRSPKGAALILTPTRELAKQVLEVVHQLIGQNSDIRTAFIIGGEAYNKQLTQLRANPRIVVGTPGRINDHLERGTLKLHDAGFLVLDETDRMLDMGFGVQLDKIIKHLPKNRQTLMFSATLPKGIVALSSKYLKNPERISVGETNVIAKNITQESIQIEQSDKYKELLVQLHARQGSVIIFVKTKYNAEKMAKKLRAEGFTSEGLHGDLRQNKRDKVMKNFRQQNFRVLVATDIAARGLDVPHIEHVINYDLPQVAEDYIHRMGRTARAGATGQAISFVSPQDGRKWHAIECLLNPDAAAHGHKAPPQGKNKARRKPYRGRPESGNKGPKKFKEKNGQFTDQPRRDKQDGQKRPEKHFDKHDDTRTENQDQERGNEKPYNKKSQNDQPHGEKRRDKNDNKNRSRKHAPKQGQNRSNDSDKKSYGAKSENGDAKTADYFIKDRKPEKKKPNSNNPGKKFSKKKSGRFKPDGSAPIKRGGPQKPSHRKVA